MKLKCFLILVSHCYHFSRKKVLSEIRPALSATGQGIKAFCTVEDTGRLGFMSRRAMAETYHASALKEVRISSKAISAASDYKRG